jgi:toxin ParE1/3/4
VTRLVLRQAAERDISEATDHCFGEGGIDLAIRLAEAVDAALLHVETHPASGSPRYAVELSLQGLRSWQTKSHPYIVFYVEGAGQVEVWRGLPAHQDIAAWLTEADAELTAASRGK